MAKSMELWGTSILTAQDPFASLTTSRSPMLPKKPMEEKKKGVSSPGAAVL